VIFIERQMSNCFVTYDEKRSTWY